MCSLKPGVEKHIDRYSALFSATSWVTACHSMSQHVTACHSMSQHVTACHIMSQHHNCPGSKSTGRLAGSTWLWLKDAKSMLKIAQILRSPATISSFATCLQFVSLCFHPIHSHLVKKKKISYKSHPIFILSEITIFLYFQIIVHGGSTGIVHQRARAINGPVRPSVWDLCRFCMTRPEPRPTTFISGQETLASVAYQGGSIWSMVGKQVETYCDLVMLIGFKIMTFNIILIDFNRI